MKILITGGAGFIGSHTTELLVEHRHEVTVADDFSNGSLANLAAVEEKIVITQLDIRDLEALTAACRGMDAVIHLAAVSSVEKSITEPLATHEVNTSGFLSVMEAARENKVKKVIFSSSAAVYGDDPEMPKTEESPVRPLSPYAWHKLTCEFYGKSYRSLHGVDFLALRYFNVYGTRQDPASPYSGVLSIFIDRARDNRQLVIFGDGGQTRDFIHVSDVARANLKAVESSGQLPPIMNVATGRETSIIQVADKIQALCGSSAGFVHETPRQGDINRSCASGDLLADTLGIRPSVEIDQGLADLIRG
jgi:UDP-glucose 4-epimerase